MSKKYAIKTMSFTFSNLNWYHEYDIKVRADYNIDSK